MRYNIRPRSYTFARKLGVHIQPSTKAFKKIDVYIKNPKKPGEYRYCCSVGDRRYMDFHLWKTLEQRGKIPPGTAAKRRQAYYTRHFKDLRKRHSPGYFAWWLLWN